jgi:hypothetical protein
MTTTKIKIFILFHLVVCSLQLQAQSGAYISLKQQTEVLENRNKMTTEVDLFLDNNRKILTKYYHSSPDFIMVSNALGEIKTYYPKNNEVAYRQLSELSSKRNLIYYFANNLTDNLGLAEEGFTLESNTFEDNYYVTIWKSPSILTGIATVKMVFENSTPIYSEYKASEEKILKKTYYTNYKNFERFRLPMKILEISYKSDKDSIMSRTEFSNVKISSSADNSYFDFKIPEDAKPIATGESR